MSQKSITISCFLLSFIVVFSLATCSIFADSEEEFSSLSAIPDDAQILEFAQQLAAASTSYTVDDIYSLLRSIFLIDYSSSGGSYVPNRILKSLQSIVTYLTDNTSRVSLADTQTILASLMSRHFSENDGVYIDALLQEISSKISNIDLSFPDVIPWRTTFGSYYGASQSLTGAYLSSGNYSGDLFFWYSVSEYDDGILSFDVPCFTINAFSPEYFSIKNIFYTDSSGSIHQWQYSYDFYIKPYSHGYRVYLTNLIPYSTNSRIVIQANFSYPSKLYSNADATVMFLSSESVYYPSFLTALVNEKISYKLLSYKDVLNSILSINNSISSKIDEEISVLNKLNTMDWISTGSYLGTSKDSVSLSEFLNNSTIGIGSFYSQYSVDFSANVVPRPENRIYRFFIPISAGALGRVNQVYNSLTYSFGYVSNSGVFYPFDSDTFFIHDMNGTYFYAFVQPSFNSNIAYMSLNTISNSSYAYLNNTVSSAVSFIPSSNPDYWRLYDFFNSTKSMSALSALQEMYADESMIAAKDESKEVIDDTLDGFTGDSKAAVQKSQTSSMKGLSSDMQDGLNGGGDVSNATGVFTTSSPFWGWFSKSNSDNINGIVSSGSGAAKAPQRVSIDSPDFVPDFKSLRDAEYWHLLGGE